MPTLTRPSRTLLLTAAAVYLAAMVVLLITGHTDLRHSSDTTDTTPILILWLPAIVGSALICLLPPKSPPPEALSNRDPRTTAGQVWILAALAIAFAVALHLAPGTTLWFIGLKFVLLLALPLLLRAVTIGEWARIDTRGRWLRPLMVVAAFAVTVELVSPWTDPVAPDAVTLAGVFVINAVVEEIFYRFWLQTRLETHYGRWPAIAMTSVLFAAWHSAIHGGAGILVDLAAAVIDIGVTGLFLGYLWSRYRNPWLQILVHGLINAPIGMLVAMA
ncbi:CPBP family intramembrane glutamic endopeptidase [Nocardia pseudobrasiliensis]|uniref:CAAX prenyl protease-like protein n=1 Tax=Nocardia pseudobrasiliensis TaxID=45979 RepID=A0A370IDE5_9NOCA|nr:CPBP family intramembrane glutamic endopeptidase [Nocardia pseudobrasiliensis]RDI67424.1 CAAX prenyl protease-like protein [Nocardia pseudobrasiliensis]